MAAPKGNQFWKMVKDPTGRPKMFETPQELWDAAVGYFEWVEANPLEEEKLFHFQGEVVRANTTKMRAMTLQAFYLFAGIDRSTFENYDSKEGYEEFFSITTRIRETIKEQKFTGAAAELLNPNIIARDLGLTDKKVVEQTGSTVNYNIPEGASAKEAAQEYLDIINQK